MQTRRLFFALWPVTKVVHDIKLNNRILKQSLKGNFIAQTNWHVTLAFLGNVANETLLCLVERAKKIQCPSFEIAFTTVRYFKKPKVVCYGIDNNEINGNVNFLANECKRIQDECGLKSESRDFMPHITVIRKAQKLNHELDITPIVWQATEFVLVMSELTESGSVYTVLHRWNLTT